MKLAIGTYTVNTESDGIYILEINLEKKMATRLTTIPCINPSFLHFNALNSILYSVKEVGNFEGELISFRLSAAPGHYEILSSLPTWGSSPCHIALSQDQKYLIVSNYSSGNFVTYKVAEDGTPAFPAVNNKFAATSIHPTRQKQSHIHSAFFSPCGAKVFIQDLGGDIIYQFDIDKIEQENAPYLSHIQSAGSGPRFVAFLKQAPILYILNELKSSIDVYSLNSSSSIDTHLQHISLNSEQYKNGVDQGAHIKLSDDEKFLYASNRGDKNIISVFSVQKDYTLKLIQCIYSGGIGPRHFEISPDQKWVLIANQFSNLICIFRRDELTGELLSNEMQFNVPSPACITCI